MASESPVRKSALRIAKQLVDRGREAEAIELLCVAAVAGPNDPDGQALLAEALRINPASELAKLAFARMVEGATADQAALDQAIATYDADRIQALDREFKPANFRRAQVGFNNNVKYKGATYHVQTEDSGLDRPHVITHLFADGGRIIKSHKRVYTEHVERDDVAKFVRALMKGQHMEMLIMLREGRFDPVIAGEAVGGMEQLTGEPNVDVSRVASIKAREKAAAKTGAVAAPPAAARARCVLHVQRSLAGGPPRYEIFEEEAVVGQSGHVKLLGDKFCHPREALLRFRDQRLFIQDLPGGCGAFLRIRSRVELIMGDEFIVGDQLLRVEANPEPDDAPDPDPTYFYSSPKWPSAFRVVQIFEGGAPGSVALARGGLVQVGSTDGELLVHGDPLVQDAHCVVEEQAGSLVLTDLESRTGVFVRLREEVELTHGDELLFGRTRLLVDLRPKERSVPPPPG